METIDYQFIVAWNDVAHVEGNNRIVNPLTGRMIYKSSQVYADLHEYYRQEVNKDGARICGHELEELKTEHYQHVYICRKCYDEAYAGGHIATIKRDVKFNEKLFDIYAMHTKALLARKAIVQVIANNKGISDKLIRSAMSVDELCEEIVEKMGGPAQSCVGDYYPYLRHWSRIDCELKGIRTDYKSIMKIADAFDRAMMKIANGEKPAPAKKRKPKRAEKEVRDCEAEVDANDCEVEVDANDCNAEVEKSG